MTDSKSFFVIIKYKETITTTKKMNIYLFKDAESAYEFAINMNRFKGLPKEIHSLSDALQNKVIWKTTEVYASYFVCKIVPVENDVIWSIYDEDLGTHNIVKNIYENIMHYKLIKKSD